MTKAKKYNLQVPIEKEVEARLRELASDMGLGLTQYCRWVLMQHVRGVNIETKIVEQVSQNSVGEQTTEPKNEMEQTSQPKGAFGVL